MLEISDDEILDNDQYLDDMLGQALRPLKHQEFYNLYRKQVETYWFESRIDWKNDKKDFSELSFREQEYIKYGIGFFYYVDIFVIKILDRIKGVFQIPELELFYAQQCGIEGVHNDFYGKMAELILGLEFVNDKRKQREFLRRPCARAKIAWFKKWLKHPVSMDVAQAGLFISEFLFVTGNFIPFGFLKNKGGKCKGIIDGNDGVSLDEYIHTISPVLLLNKRLKWRELYKINDEVLEERGMKLLLEETELGSRISFKDLFLQMINEAVEAQSVCERELLENPIGDLNSQTTINYIKYITNVYCLKLDLIEKKLVYPEAKFSVLPFMDNWYKKNESRVCLHEVQSTSYKNSRLYAPEGDKQLLSLFRVDIDDDGENEEKDDNDKKNINLTNKKNFGSLNISLSSSSSSSSKSQSSDDEKDFYSSFNGSSSTNFINIGSSDTETDEPSETTTHPVKIDEKFRKKNDFEITKAAVRAKLLKESDDEDEND